MGSPRDVRKLENAQKNVLLSSATKVHVGSGWKPGSMGLQKIDTFCAALRDSKAAVTSVLRIVGFI